MHTSYQLDSGHFGIKLGDVASTRNNLLANWSCYDRAGTIVDEPFGAVGASLLLQLSITSFYDTSPNRRQGSFFSEVYLFHVGGRFGDHSSYDIYPRRKEIFIENDPVAVLEAINDRAITRLLVVDKAPKEVKHHFKEPECAKERIISAFSYSPTGQVQQPDIELTGLDRCVMDEHQYGFETWEKSLCRING
ncbi:hypothetical protein [Paremcibacter congregatus]|uniref:hypothetical protein n=1 Tax=Paremcibacter congregatus TaxID=2043170 RepID=UPI0010546B23|nr:hypothetical protein [Paremcibacter congregatus]QDE27989.1 hypothetical protein FIV45_12260 [Paremcibacter congregatus]